MARTTRLGVSGSVSGSHNVADVQVFGPYHALHDIAVALLFLARSTLPTIGSGTVLPLQQTAVTSSLCHGSGRRWDAVPLSVRLRPDLPDMTFGSCVYCVPYTAGIVVDVWFLCCVRQDPGGYHCRQAASTAPPPLRCRVPPAVSDGARVTDRHRVCDGTCHGSVRILVEVV